MTGQPPAAPLPVKELDREREGSVARMATAVAATAGASSRTAVVTGPFEVVVTGTSGTSLLRPSF